MSIRVKPNICYAPSILYKPEFAYAPPDGYRAESFIVPFSFNILANGEIQADNPWKLDDDVPWVWRGMVWPQVGTAEQVNATSSGILGTPMLTRVRDTHGNPLSTCNQTNGYVLGFGAIGQSGFDNINAFGFPFGCEIQCEPGGVILFDFQIPNIYASAQAQVAQVFLTAKLSGTGGNALTITVVVAGNNTPLSVTVVGNAITVNSATDGLGNATTTSTQAAAAILANAAAAALVLVRVIGDGTLVLSDSGGPVAFYGGTNTPQVVIVQGANLGVKLFKDC